ncbi:hypothetical protein EGR_06029 [Echinococcus granulosus]|uniref:Uncharacterized protein n=1 Tax=Echinococcus granulosus TaxID=6210 RepID=W6UE66_ECHGR|nr:hypothetical protein EGR_06029 [Echinococcus granulosus]EUB59166.1 hypothetical protein EGR_06029 [Echinococcus granulosus]
MPSSVSLAFLFHRRIPAYVMRCMNLVSALWTSVERMRRLMYKRDNVWRLNVSESDALTKEMGNISQYRSATFTLSLHICRVPVPTIYLDYFKINLVFPLKSVPQYFWSWISIELKIIYFHLILNEILSKEVDWDLGAKEPILKAQNNEFYLTIFSFVKLLRLQNRSRKREVGIGFKQAEELMNDSVHFICY